MDYKHLLVLSEKDFRPDHPSGWECPVLIFPDITLISIRYSTNNTNNNDNSDVAADIGNFHIDKKKGRLVWDGGAGRQKDTYIKLLIEISEDAHELLSKKEHEEKMEQKSNTLGVREKRWGVAAQVTSIVLVVVSFFLPFRSCGTKSNDTEKQSKEVSSKIDSIIHTTVEKEVDSLKSILCLKHQSELDKWRAKHDKKRQETTKDSERFYQQDFIKEIDTFKSSIICD